KWPDRGPGSSASGKLDPHANHRAPSPRRVMKQFDAAATARALPFPALIDALERLFVAGCDVPARHVHAVGDALTALLMPAWLPGRYLGLKVVNVAPGNAALGLPAVFATYQLFDAGTGAPLALIDGG